MDFKIKSTETVLEYYMRMVKENIDKKIIFSIINSVFFEKNEKLSEKDKDELIELMSFIKDDKESVDIAENLTLNNTYTEILKERIQEQQNKIHNSLTIKQMANINNIYTKLIKINKDLCIIGFTNGNTHTEVDFDETMFRNIAESIFYFKNGAMVFYFKENNKTICFGFVYDAKTDTIINISVSDLKKYSPYTNNVFVSADMILKGVRE